MPHEKNILKFYYLNKKFKFFLSCNTFFLKLKQTLQEKKIFKF